ncbi:hypothetical protein SAMD00019534_047110 [Acytostelium subglobosum LB1]|uniref:hypothetical protein n=1 Tax=Acytostelium subglobosum LB1 TaxID=1410327 RepID=UPI000644ACF9|nr:hypothetical protein SAMD00019534_047110 [Acytostelium subglobosum LB1]GAM21536.1 hypothetical protein SAMD00019534_047110 [Acytostelium subglobosum LB1]|eukprot:XP_012755655.1 hypothetical protein SAMD00019534_047110 [Acytostelium subglobosum LB1]
MGKLVSFKRLGHLATTILNALNAIALFMAIFTPWYSIDINETSITFGWFTYQTQNVTHQDGVANHLSYGNMHIKQTFSATLAFLILSVLVIVANLAMLFKLLLWRSQYSRVMIKVGRYLLVAALVFETLATLSFFSLTMNMRKDNFEHCSKDYCDSFFGSEWGPMRGFYSALSTVVVVGPMLLIVMYKFSKSYRHPNGASGRSSGPSLAAAGGFRDDDDTRSQYQFLLDQIESDDSDDSAESFQSDDDYDGGRGLGGRGGKRAIGNKDESHQPTIYPTIDFKLDLNIMNHMTPNNKPKQVAPSPTTTSTPIINNQHPDIVLPSNIIVDPNQLYTLQHQPTTNNQIIYTLQLASTSSSSSSSFSII